MTSPSEMETAVSEQETTPSLVEGNARRTRETVRLEFASIDMMRSRPEEESPSNPEPDWAMLQEKQEDDLRQREAEAEQRRFALELGAALQRGKVEGREEIEEEAEQKIAAERMSVLRTCEAFRKERDTYFKSVETEVVKLALAIAARILHREVNLDPLLLRAVVKVALEKTMEESDTVLRVPMEDVAAWREVIGSDDEPAAEVQGDARLGRGECVLETRVGKVELGIEAQLEEIEKGFFDLLQQRPA